MVMCRQMDRGMGMFAGDPQTMLVLLLPFCANWQCRGISEGNWEQHYPNICNLLGTVIFCSRFGQDEVHI